MIQSQVTTRVHLGEDTIQDGAVAEDATNGIPSGRQYCENDDEEGDQDMIHS
jgi:hypothetical protein